MIYVVFAVFLIVVYIPLSVIWGLMGNKTYRRGRRRRKWG